MSALRIRGRYSVVETFDGRASRPFGRARFTRLAQAVKERDRLMRAAWSRVDTHADLLRNGSFRYGYRIWDHTHRGFADCEGA